MLINKPYFCVVPWIEMATSPNGIMKPCCFFENMSPIHFGNLKENSIDDVWNCNELKQIRFDLLNGIKNPHCQYCYDIEKTNAISRRIMMNNGWLQKVDLEKDIINNTLVDGTYLKKEILYLDIRFSNVCNFSCRMCQPEYSTTSLNKLSMTIEKYNIENVEEWFDDNIDYFKNLEVLFLAGGEPFLQKEHYQLLRWLIKNEIYPELFYQTNGSILNGNVPILWENFPKVRVSISLDGLGLMGEYIRTGYTDRIVLANIEHIKNIIGKDNIVIYSTIQAYNVYFVTEFFNELISKDFCNIENIHLTLLLEPKHLQCCVLPEELKIEAKDKILKNNNQDKFQSILFALDKQCDEQLTNQFLETVDNSIIEYFPQLKKYIGKL
jgi:MoaA/NifB/PqqE/SkfB family radical SAM enzyme